MTDEGLSRSDGLRLLAALWLALWALHVDAKTVALTLALSFDDGLNPELEPRAEQWNADLLGGLKAASISSMLFPAASKVGAESGMQLVRDWSRAGHAIGNHTTRHRSLGSASVSLSSFIDDVENNDARFGSLPTWQRMLRFPYLKEGNTADKRDGMRAWMRANGYRAAPVSIDTSDWYFNQAWLRLLDVGSAESRAQLQRLYVAHLLERAHYYDALAQQVLHRSPAHVMLLHANAINAASIAQVAAAFRADGWRFVSPQSAFADPVYTFAPKTVPAGESLIWALAREAGVGTLRYPGEDSVYEEPKLKELGLAP